MAENRWTAKKTDKPIILRVKRKVSQSRWDTLRLEIDEYPLLRKAVQSSTNRVEELQPKTILVQHLQTVSSSEETYIVLRSFVSNSSEALKVKQKNSEGRQLAKIENVLSTNARFEQVCRSMTLQKEASACRLYDVVQVDVEGCGSEVEEMNGEDLFLLVDGFNPANIDKLEKIASLFLLEDSFNPVNIDDLEKMASLVHLEEDLTTMDIESHMCKQAPLHCYAYDFYTVIESVGYEAELGIQFPLVRVVDDDGYFYDGLDNSDNSDSEMEDSNGKDDCINNNPPDLDISSSEESKDDEASKEMIPSGESSEESKDDETSKEMIPSGESSEESKDDEALKEAMETSENESVTSENEFITSMDEQVLALISGYRDYLEEELMEYDLLVV